MYDKEENDMSAVIKPIETIDMDKLSEDGIKKLMDVLCNPAKPSEFLEKIFNEYKEQESRK